MPCAALEGLHVDGVIGRVIESAVERWRIAPEPGRRGRPRRAERLRVGFTFNVKRVTPDPLGEQDEEAEYDSPKTIKALRRSLESLGKEVVELEADGRLPVRLAASGADLVFNIAEGTGSRNREAQVPALCEILDIPHTGSDAATLAITAGGHIDATHQTLAR